MISANLRIVAIAGSLALLVFIIELVRRRRLKEEYSVLWVLTALALLLLAAWGALLRDLAQLIGANSQASTLYLFSIIFIAFLLLHFSVRVSNLERRVVVLLQEVALLAERERRAAEDRVNGTADGLRRDEQRSRASATALTHTHDRGEADVIAAAIAQEAGVR
jgi:hypothetical protein